MTTDITPAEVKAVRWVEQILAPLIVVAIVTLATCANQTSEALAQLEIKQAQTSEINGDTKTAIKEINKTQQAIKVQVERIETHQDHFKDEISDLKTQNNEILQILRKSD